MTQYQYISIFLQCLWLCYTTFFLSYILSKKYELFGCSFKYKTFLDKYLYIGSLEIMYLSEQFVFLKCIMTLNIVWFKSVLSEWSCQHTSVDNYTHNTNTITNYSHKCLIWKYIRHLLFHASILMSLKHTRRQRFFVQKIFEEFLRFCLFGLFGHLIYLFSHC